MLLVQLTKLEKDTSLKLANQASYIAQLSPRHHLHQDHHLVINEEGHFQDTQTRLRLDLKLDLNTN